MLAYRLRRWHNSNPALSQRLVYAGLTQSHCRTFPSSARVTFSDSLESKNPGRCIKTHNQDSSVYPYSKKEFEFTVIVMKG